MDEKERYRDFIEAYNEEFEAPLSFQISTFGKKLLSLVYHYHSKSEAET
jgi:hypothetical protein